MVFCGFFLGDFGRIGGFLFENPVSFRDGLKHWWVFGACFPARPMGLLDVH